MTLRKSILLFVALGLIAAFAACGSSSSSPTNSISTTSGTPQSAQVGTPFAVLTATVMSSNGGPAAGASVIFTAPSSGASCVFASNSTNTETDLVNSFGVATSSVCTANTEAGAYSVTATISGTTTSVSFALTNTAGAAAAIVASSGNNSTANTGATFGSLVAQVQDSDGNGVSGVTVTFTANTGASGATGTFTSTSSSTETATTDANGNATVSDLVANSTAGTFTVTADFSGDDGGPATFNLTNTTPAATLGNGNYAFFLSGLDIPPDYSFSFVSGVFTVSGGVITGGEQDYVDFDNYSNNENGGADLINPTGSSLSITADGNLQIVLTTCAGSTCTSTDGVVGAAGVETINATLSPSNPNRAVLAEFDGGGTATGEMRLQDPTAAAATPSAGYAFAVSGFDFNGNILNLGGILNVDGAGTISGNGSIFDANDDFSGTSFQNEALEASSSTVSAPDSFGRVTFTITPSDSADFAQIVWVGYIADSSRIYMVETADNYVGTTGGIALSQGGSTGTFSTASISGATLGAAMTGWDSFGALQTVADLTFNSNGTVSGFVDFNDLSGSEPASPDPVTAPSYTVDSTGRVTVSGVTDGVSASFTVQFYLNGNGTATAVTMDTTDTQGTTLAGQISGPFSDANFTGNYAMTAIGWDFDEDGFYAGVGPVAATGSGDTFSGFADLNYFNSTVTAVVPTANEAVSGSYTETANGGIFSSFITGLDIDSGFTNTDAFDMYQVNSDGTAVVIETDSNQLTLGLIQP